MKKLLASMLPLALALMLPVQLGAAARQTGQISGTALVDGKPLAGVTVRLRNVDTGALVGTTTANAQGEFSFTGLAAGNFIVETVSANGTILGTSVRIALTAAAMVAANISVSTSAAALAAAGGVGAAAGAGAAAGGAAAAGGGFLATTAGVATLGAVTAGVVTTAIVATGGDASPSR
jgi:hypothetical protein